MIRVNRETELTAKNVAAWYREWEKDKKRLDELRALFLNQKNGKPLLKMPFAKKLVMTSAAATAGDGVTISAPDTLSAPQKKTFDKVQELLKRQTIIAEDNAVIADGCTYGRGYELCYMSSDEVPIPKCAKIPATNAFVVFDDTVEQNSLFGVYFETSKSAGNVEMITFYIFDSVFKYTFQVQQAHLDGLSDSELDGGIEHHMGRMPLTEFSNNDDQQSDFEQVIPLMYDRTDVHNLNIKDMKAIAKNYLKGRNVEFAGTTEGEKAKTRDKAANMQMLEVAADDSDPNSDIGILSKNENYTSVDVFGRDIDSKIYDLSMIPNLADDQFAGNQTGVALELKLMPFVNLVESKDANIEKLYRRRLKMYMAGLTTGSKEYAPFDAGEITIEIHRSWTKNAAEIGQLITQLHTTALFSEKKLVNMLPDADYDDEQAQKAIEAEERAKQQTKQADPMNGSLEDLVALMRGGAAGTVGNDKF